MLAVVPDSKLVRIARRLISRDVEESNYVLQLLLGNWVDANALVSYEPKSFRWNRRLDEPSNVAPPGERHVEYNDIDMDLLRAAMVWHLKNIS
jgi:hypothetical protein